MVIRFKVLDGLKMLKNRTEITYFDHNFLATAYQQMSGYSIITFSQVATKSQLFAPFPTSSCPKPLRFRVTRLNYNLSATGRISSATFFSNLWFFFSSKTRQIPSHIIMLPPLPFAPLQNFSIVRANVTFKIVWIQKYGAGRRGQWKKFFSRIFSVYASQDWTSETLLKKSYRTSVMLCWPEEGREYELWITRRLILRLIKHARTSETHRRSEYQMETSLQLTGFSLWLVYSFGELVMNERSRVYERTTHKSRLNRETCSIDLREHQKTRMGGGVLQ